MSYQPIPFTSDVANLLSLAQGVANDFSRAPRVFSAGEQAVFELISELRFYQQSNSTRTVNNNQQQHDAHSPLIAHLRPCRDALDAMAQIRRKYPFSSHGNLGFMDRMRWKFRHASQFARRVAALRQETARLREMVHELRRSMSAVATPSNSTQTRTATATARPTPTKMCPNGSGCRTPCCHLRYLHPGAETCENGKNCGIRDCQKWHPKSAVCPKGTACPRAGCDKAHPWPQELPNSNYMHVASNNDLCSLSFKCQDGYNGVCPLKHPKRAPCRDFDNGSCAKGASCSFDHRTIQVSRASAAANVGQGSRGYSAELSAQVGGQYMYLAELPVSK